MSGITDFLEELVLNTALPLRTREIAAEELRKIQAGTVRPKFADFPADPDPGDVAVS